MFETTALDIWRKEVENRSIITLCKSLDRSLGSGIPASIITEFCGPPGSGKTQFCFQLAVNVQIPKDVGGVGSKCVWIDTNQNFDPHRLKQIATISTKRFNNIFKSSESFNCETILNNIFYNYTNDYVELLAVIERLKDLIIEKGDIKLIIIDSFAFLFRSFKDYKERVGILYQLLTDLQIIADKYSIAIVITNEMTTKFLGPNETCITAALGDSHFHKIGQRISLGPPTSECPHYVATLDKSLHSPKGRVHFTINDGGVRGIKNTNIN